MKWLGIKMDVSSFEKRNYVLKNKEDFAILEKIKILEKRGLNKQDRGVIKLIRTQLEKNWRGHLICCLDKMINKKV